jgi:predicted metalloprotease
MRWEGNEESGNLEDRRGWRTKGMAVGGGATLLILIAAAIFGVDPELLQNFLGQPNRPGAPVEERQLTPEELRYRKFAGTILRFTEKVWEEQFQQAGHHYIPPHMVLFSDRVETACGVAPSAVGPFYCPADKTIYLDPTFFDELEKKLGGSRAEFSQAYVIAHEVGHHVQNLLGYSDLVHKKRALPPAEYNKWSVRLELQADYLAGVWAYHGQRQFKFIEPGDIESAIKSANAIGDDRLQRRSTGFTSPEKYTHGTSEQRVRWFRRGLETGNLSKLKVIFDLPYDEL